MKKISRRDFLKIIKYLLADSFLAALSGTIYSTLIEPLWFDINEIAIALPNLPKTFSGLRILQISDIHAGEQFMPSRLMDVIVKVKRLKPDLVVITGDFVDSSEGMTEDILNETGEILTHISEAFPTFAVMGNHDHWWDVDKVRGMLQYANIIELINDFYMFEKQGYKIYLCGVDDFWVRKSDLGNIISHLPDDSCAILLAHEPDFADKSSVRNRFDLQLSGHSHGGQIVIPFYGAPMLPRHGKKYPSGLYKIKKMFLYTNRGVGMASPYVRFNCRPEITLFTLHSQT